MEVILTGSERPPKLKTELFELAAARRLLLTSVK